MVVPFQHVSTLQDLAEEALLEMMRLARECEKHLRATYRPDGLNIGMNLGRSAGAGIADHIHMHVLPMISFSGINKQYGKQLIFVDASFQLNPGEKVGLVGPNGSGKTTLFRMVVGEEVPDEGESRFPRSSPSATSARTWKR
jgi:ABC-type molybdenum transport system ATPase subunit/photorepair protein PhrA